MREGQDIFVFRVEDQGVASFPDVRGDGGNERYLEVLIHKIITRFYFY
jgi:hypothetical protein